ncbi:hypothetical protein [uncultured Adlercreutzia sp.]|uniref:hypothetical protein n=1 Tax=uncultured Adlercreutzia sp. TaxID=875803 RepID=UPI0025A5B805|nr:hypothetical protein [uncultured Adlercreutzia sp.]
MFHAMTEQEIDGFEDYLADVLCVWDCYEQERVTGSPLVLRFESADVVADLEMGDLYWIDSSNEASVDALVVGYEQSDAEGPCLTLVRFESAARMVGEKWSAAHASRALTNYIS